MPQENTDEILFTLCYYASWCQVHSIAPVFGSLHLGNLAALTGLRSLDGVALGMDPIHRKATQKDSAEKIIIS